MAERERPVEPGGLTDDDYAKIAGLPPAIWHLASELHYFVGGFAGRLPDALVAQLRRWIGAEDLQGVTEAVALAALSSGIAVTPDEARAVASFPAAFERASELPEGLVVAEGADDVVVGFTSGPPMERTADGPVDPLDRAVFQTLYQSPDVVAIRRAVRSATEREPERRVYLFELCRGAVLWQFTAEVQKALEAAGEAVPLVEGFWSDRGPTAYQRAASEASTALWVRPVAMHTGSPFGRALDQQKQRGVQWEWFQWTPEVWADLTALHRMIQQHTVRIDDAILLDAIRLLANGRLADLVALLSSVVGRDRAAWSDADVAVLRAIPARVDAADLDVSALDQDSLPDGAAAVRTDRRIVAGPDPSGTDDDLLDAVVDVVCALAAEQPGVRKVWWSWTVTDDEPETPFILMEVEPGLGGWGVASAVTEYCAGRAGFLALVDTFWPGAELPEFHRDVLASATLVWSASDPAADHNVGVCVAEMYDAADGQGQPLFAADRPRIDDPDERRRLVARLDAGETMALYGDWRAVDLLDPEHRRRVQLDYRGDGAWIWRDSVAYYLEKYGIAPSAPLLAHLRKMEAGAAG